MALSQEDGQLQAQILDILSALIALRGAVSNLTYGHPRQAEVWQDLNEVRDTINTVLDRARKLADNA